MKFARISGNKLQDQSGREMLIIVLLPEQWCHRERPTGHPPSEPLPLVIKIA